MKNQKLALLFAGIIFALVAVAHLLRLTYHTIVFVGPYMVPVWVSLVGFVISLFLSIWMFCARGCKK